MATAEEYGLRVGETYQSRKGSRSPDRKILWISSDGTVIQYDGPAVPIGRLFPRITADGFAKWAGISVLASGGGS